MPSRSYPISSVYASRRGRIEFIVIPAVVVAARVRVKHIVRSVVAGVHIGDIVPGVAKVDRDPIFAIAGDGVDVENLVRLAGGTLGRTRGTDRTSTRAANEHPDLAVVIGFLGVDLVAASAADPDAVVCVMVRCEIVDIVVLAPVHLDPCRTVVVAVEGFDDIDIAFDEDAYVPILDVARKLDEIVVRAFQDVNPDFRFPSGLPI